MHCEQRGSFSFLSQSGTFSPEFFYLQCHKTRQSLDSFHVKIEEQFPSCKAKGGQNVQDNDRLDSQEGSVEIEASNSIKDRNTQ